MPARASASRAARRARGHGWRRGTSARSAISASSRSSSSEPSVVERAERLVEDEQLGLVKQARQSASRCSIPREKGRARSLRDVPEAEALEQHPDPLAPLGDVVEAPVEIEVLERGQLAVDERLVAEEADPRGRARPRARLRSGRRARRRDGAASSCRSRSARSTSRNPPARRSKSRPLAARAWAERFAEPPRAADHASASASTKTKNATLITPFM